MSAKVYTVFAKDSTTGAAITGLSLVWVGSTVYNVDTAATITAPAFTEVGAGFYAFPYDAAANGSMCGTIDLTASGPSGAGRYLRVVISATNSSIQPVLTDRLAPAAAGGGGGGSGTVTSVGQTVPAEFSVAGSPVTTSGTLAITKATQAANIVWSGPTTGSAAAPTFRALVTADMPATVALLASPTFTGTVTTAGLAIGDGSNVALGTSTGTQIGTASGQKIGFFGTAPAIQQTGNVITALSNLGLVTSGTLTESNITSLTSDLALKAPLASPTFTGTVTTATVSAVGGVTVTAASSSTIPVVVAGAASQTADLQDWNNSAGSILGSITAAGLFGLGITPTLGIHALGGSARIQRLATPAAPTATVNSGSGTNYFYFIVAEDRAGLKTVQSAVSNTASSSATPNNTITWSAVPGAVKYYILRNTSNTVSGTGNFLITTWTSGALSITDTSAAGTSFAVPTLNGTGDLTVDGLLTVSAGATLSGNVTCSLILNAAYADQANTKGFIQTGTSGINFDFNNRADANIPIVVRQKSGTQSGDLIKLAASDGTTLLSKIDATGLHCMVTQATSGTPAASPPSGSAGALIFDTANFKLWAWTGTAWKSVTLA